MIQKLIILSPAKLNLFLKIQGRAANGFHYLSSLICPCTLADEIELEITNINSQITFEVQIASELSLFLKSYVRDLKLLETSLNDIVSSNNLAFRAAQSYLSTSPRVFDEPWGVKIKLLKRIPFGAGLGGGSGNAAAVLAGLNCLAKHPISDEHLGIIGRQLGSDIPAQLRFGLTYVGGFGEIVRDVAVSCNSEHFGLGAFENLGVVIVVPPCMVSTVIAYQKLGMTKGFICDDVAVQNDGITQDTLEFLRKLGLELKSNNSERYNSMSLDQLNAKISALGRSISLTFNAEAGTSGCPDDKTGLDNENCPVSAVPQDFGAKCFAELSCFVTNSFESVVEGAYQEIAAVRAEMMRLGAEVISMTGSGSALCSYFPSEEQAQEFAMKLSSNRETAKCYVVVVRLLTDAFSWAVAKR